MASKIANKKRSRVKHSNTRWLIGGGIAAVLVVAALILINTSSAAPAASPSSNALGQCGQPTCGSAAAPVTIEIYGDFQ